MPSRPVSGERRSPFEVLIAILETTAVGRVRRAVAAAMAEIGASKMETTRMVTAASELARNTLTHGGGGEVRIALIGIEARRKVEITFVDQGPGIADVALALKDGYSTGGGLGLGLGGAKRLCKEFEVRSEPGRGTTVRVASWMERG